MSTRGIIRPGRNCLVSKSVEATGIVIDARDYYRFFYHAARQARNYILISGWQFDSSVSLLRGEDAKDAGEDIRFLNFLNIVCDENPGLRVYILAWNFSYIYILRREWMQKRIFTQANPAISFHFDNRHAFAASQHQKFVVIDGYASFVGGMDICASRWDDRRHSAHNPFRVDSNGRAYGPYHDVNSYHTGPVSEELTEIFRRRWLNATGKEIKLAPARRGDYVPGDGLAVAIAAGTVAISRTQARSLARRKMPVSEIRSLYIDAIRSARSLIYIENQYFSSYAVYRALVKRMKRCGSKLQIVFILPRKEQTLIENIYVGIAQTRLLKSLRRVARREGHSMGIYFPVVRSKDGQEEQVFVHSKLMIVDDGFMTIGSANANNRSMGLDAELNVSWEAPAHGQKEFVESVKKARVDLLAEHTGGDTQGALDSLGRIDGLVAYLDSVADSPAGRLRRHRMKRSHYTSGVLRYLKLDKIIVDPERAVIDENIIAVVSSHREPFLKRGIGYLKRLIGK